MSIDMNNKGAQTMAILVVAFLLILAWNLGNKQAMNSLLVDSISSTTPTLMDGIVPSKNNNSSTTLVEKSKNLGERIFSLVGSASGESVTVEDQPAGTEVKVKSLKLSETGWAGVRDADGRVLGAGRFDAGNFENVVVPLLRGTVAGSSYQVLLYADDGDREFDLHKDTLIIGAGGGVAGTNFKAL
jgi:hypothetical protein